MEFLAVTIDGVLRSINTSEIYLIKEDDANVALLTFNGALGIQESESDDLTYSAIIALGLITHIELPVITRITDAAIETSQQTLVNIAIIDEINENLEDASWSNLKLRVRREWRLDKLVANDTVANIEAAIDSLVATGDVFKSGTPLNNQVAVFAGETIIEGDTGFQYNSATANVTIGGNLIISANNTGIIASSSIAEVVPILRMNGSNNVDVGPRFLASYGLDLWTGSNGGDIRMRDFTSQDTHFRFDLSLKALTINQGLTTATAAIDINASGSIDAMNLKTSGGNGIFLARQDRTLEAKFYGMGSVLLGGETYGLGVDVSGNIIEIPLVAGGGDVTKVGTPLNNQLGVWTGDGTIEGDSLLTWNGLELNINGDLNLSSNGITIFTPDTLSNTDLLRFQTSGTNQATNVLFLPSGTSNNVSIKLFDSPDVGSGTNLMGFGGGVTGAGVDEWAFSSVVSQQVNANSRHISFIVSNTSDGRFKTLFLDCSGNIGMGIETFIGEKLHIADGNLRIDQVSGATSQGIKINADGATFIAGFYLDQQGTRGRGVLINTVSTDSSDYLFSLRSSNTTKFVVYPDGSIAIGDVAVDSSSILEITSTLKGVLFPRMTTTQRNAISSPATSLVIYNTTTAQLEIYIGSWGAV